jgi:hypothetical protein
MSCPRLNARVLRSHKEALALQRVAERRGTNKADIATARPLMTLVYYGLRDGKIYSPQRAAA